MKKRYVLLLSIFQSEVIRIKMHKNCVENDCKKALMINLDRTLYGALALRYRDI